MRHRVGNWGPACMPSAYKSSLLLPVVDVLEPGRGAELRPMGLVMPMSDTRLLRNVSSAI